MIGNRAARAKVSLWFANEWLSDWSARVGTPQPHRGVGTARGDEVSVGAERHAVDRFGVPHRLTDGLADVRVEQPHGVVELAGSDPFAVGAECHTRYGRRRFDDLGCGHPLLQRTEQWAIESNLRSGLYKRHTDRNIESRALLRLILAKPVPALQLVGEQHVGQFRAAVGRAGIIAALHVQLSQSRWPKRWPDR
jgi:hypothetical protein